MTTSRKQFKNLLLSLVLVCTLSLLPSCANVSQSNAHDATTVESDSVVAAETGGIPAEKYSESLPSSQERLSPYSAESVFSSNLCVRFLDVGQGDCALISCDGMTLLIDGGPSSASSKVYSILKQLGIAQLDYIIVTHPDADHCGGVAGALNYASCGTLYCSTSSHDTKAFASMLKYLGSTPVTVPSLNESFSLGGATVTFVGPVSKANADTNNGSLVCRIDYGVTSFLFTGDAESESENEMISTGEPLNVDVLKVGHHGSDSSSSPQFLSATSPQYAIVSVGKNSYGHPTASAMNRLEAAGATVFRTDELGSIAVVSDGAELSVASTKGEIDE